IRGVVAFALGDLRRTERAVSGRQTEVRGPVEDREVPGLLSDERDDLDAGGPGADDPDPPAGEVHRLGRPLCAVEAATLEIGDSGDVGSVRRGQVPHREDEVLRRVLLDGGAFSRRTVVSRFGDADRPDVPRRVPYGC